MGGGRAGSCGASNFVGFGEVFLELRPCFVGGGERVPLQDCRRVQARLLNSAEGAVDHLFVGECRLC